MGNSPGAIVKDSKIIGFFEYNRSIDFSKSTTYSSCEELWKNWRTDKFNECSCDKDPIDVFLCVDGYYWEAKVCLECKAIVWEEGFFDRTEIKGFPDGMTEEMLEKSLSRKT